MPSVLEGSPAASRVTLRGLSANVLVWDPPGDADASGLTVLVLHGFADTAASFDLVAAAVARAGHRVVAPDLRGFGDSDPVGPGGYYHFPDYLADVRALVRLLAPPRLAVVGHSMGGTVAVQLAGTHPAEVERLVLLEGLGPPAHGMEAVPDRFARWLADLEAVAARPEHRSFASLEETVERLRTIHPDVPAEVLATRAPLLVRERAGGRVSWKFDPLHRTTAPMPFVLEAFKAFLSRIACPTLAIGGGRSGFHAEDEDLRVACLRQVTRLELDGAGHMMHWTAPSQVATAIVEFLRG